MRVSDANISVSFKDASEIEISWPGILGHVSWVFINGEYSEEIFADTTSKQTVASVDLNEPVRVEIHELPVGTEQQYPCEPRDADEPWVYWKPVENASSYTISGRHENGSLQILKQVVADLETKYYQEEIEQDILRDGGCYWWLKVDAISQYGVSSAADLWPYEEMGLPPLPVGVTVTKVGYGPSATLTLTIQV